MSGQLGSGRVGRVVLPDACALAPVRIIRYEDGLCLGTPEAYFVDGNCDDLLPDSYQSLEAGLAAERDAELVHGCAGRPWFATRA